MSTKKSIQEHDQQAIKFGNQIVKHYTDGEIHWVTFYPETNQTFRIFGLSDIKDLGEFLCQIAEISR